MPVLKRYSMSREKALFFKLDSLICLSVCYITHGVTRVGGALYSSLSIKDHSYFPTLLDMSRLCYRYLHLVHL